jgi:predicted dehydrogenase
VTKLCVAVVGCGYWGINHVRVFAELAGCHLKYVCDPSKASLDRARNLASGAELVTDVAKVLTDDQVQAVVIATPAVTHGSIARKALAAGKHVLVEKPMALSTKDAEELVNSAKQRGLVLAVGHLLLYHPVVLHMKELLHSQQLGELYYLHSTRVNLGKLRTDENTLWSFAPHDLSITDFLIGSSPVSVAARGESYLQKGIEDVVFVNLKYADGKMANIHLSWLNPRKERRLTLVCSKKMVEFDDVAAEKLRIYDKGYERPPEFTDFAQYLTIRHGDIHIPHVPMTEPLVAEATDFVTSIAESRAPRSDGDSGLRVVRVLEAAQKSLENEGAPVSLPT